MATMNVLLGSNVKLLNHNKHVHGPPLIPTSIFHVRTKPHNNLIMVSSSSSSRGATLSTTRLSVMPNISAAAAFNYKEYNLVEMSETTEIVPSKNPIETLVKTAILFVGFLLFWHPNSSLAASGGRMGGSSFRSSSSTSSSSRSSPSTSTSYSRSSPSTSASSSRSPSESSSSRSSPSTSTSSSRSPSESSSSRSSPSTSTSSSRSSPSTSTSSSRSPSESSSSRSSPSTSTSSSRSSPSTSTSSSRSSPSTSTSSWWSSSSTSSSSSSTSYSPSSSYSSYSWSPSESSSSQWSSSRSYPQSPPTISSSSGDSTWAFVFLLLLVVAIYALAALLQAVCAGANSITNCVGGGANSITNCVKAEEKSIIKLQVGLLGDARSLQTDLNQIARSVDTSTNEGLIYILEETACALLRLPHYCMFGYSSVDMVTSIDEAEALFKKYSIREMAKFDEITLVNVNNVRREVASSQKATGVTNDYIVVTILAAVQGRHKLPPINGRVDLQEALEKVSSLPLSGILAVEVLWTPQRENDTLSEEEFRMNYSLLHPL